MACSTSGPRLFKKQNLHDQYAEKLTNAGLQQTSLGQQWFAAAEQAITNPITISLPYRERGYFDAAQPRAVGLQFSGKQGEKLVFQLVKKAAGSAQLFADLWELNPSAKPLFIKSLDTSQTSFSLEIDDNATNYLLRLQPELLKSMDYELSVSITASLAFPVAGENRNIASYWGAERDGGDRSHEGIDIFAPRRTPAVAAAEGTITRVNENNLGGLVVWLRPKGKAYNLYYAHLDEQLVRDGQHVAKGDTIGLIGNTGNARATPPHLHFGIYTFGGAIDPLPFVNPDRKNAKEPNALFGLKEEKLRLTKSTTISIGNFAQTAVVNTIVKPLAATATSYRVLFPDGQVADVLQTNLQKADAALRQLQVNDSTFLLESPRMDAPRKMILVKSAKVTVLGIFKDFYFIRQGNEEGWAAASTLQ